MSIFPLFQLQSESQQPGPDITSVEEVVFVEFCAFKVLATNAHFSLDKRKMPSKKHMHLYTTTFTKLVQSFCKNQLDGNFFKKKKKKRKLVTV
jgi:hypothetical protein